MSITIAIGLSDITRIFLSQVNNLKTYLLQLPKTKFEFGLIIRHRFDFLSSKVLNIIYVPFYVINLSQQDWTKLIIFALYTHYIHITQAK